MRLRDQGASAYESVFILVGVTPEAAARAPEAFAGLVTQREAKPLRRRAPGHPGSGDYLSQEEAVSLVAANVHSAPADLSHEEVFGLLSRTPLVGLPISVLVSGDRIAVKTWHAELDGWWTLEVLHRLAEASVGQVSPPWPRPRSFPVLRAAVRTRAPLAIKEFLAFRRGRTEAMQTVPEPTIEQRERRHVRLLQTTLDADLIERIRTAAGSSESVNSRLISAVARTARAIYVGDGDPALMIPVHMARWAGGPVSGNMIFSMRPGGLRTADVRPEAMQALIDVGTSRTGFGGWLWDLQWPLKARLRRRSPSEAVVGELTVQISPVRSPRLFPAELWTDGVPRVRFGSVGPYPAFFSIVWRHGSEVLLAVEDETDQFDTDRYLPTLLEELAELTGSREAAAAGGSPTPGEV